MNINFIGHPLIGELLADPARFKQRGRAYQLLQEYFAELPVETLRPLLAHENILVRHAAVWIASELGGEASPVLDDVIPLIGSSDRHLVYHALEVLTVCAIGSYVDRFVLLPQALESEDDVIRSLAMRLLSRADQSQLEAAARFAETLPASRDVHRAGLGLLATAVSRNQEVRQMLLDENAVARKYGAIAAKRLHSAHADLLQMATTLSDGGLSQFARDAD